MTSEFTSHITGSHPLQPQYSAERAVDAAVLATIGFGLPGAWFDLPLRQLGPRTLVETWHSAHPVTGGDIGPVRYRANGEVMIGAVSIPDEGDVEDSTYRLFSAAVRAIREAGYPSFLRMWNHVPRINEEERGLERYRRFSIGRYRAFEEAGYRLADDLPAASAVGTHSGGLASYFLAAKTPGMQVENPRQMSAYRYPPCYGPKSPSFARATVKRWGSDGLLFLSGTASIVGHESLHAGEVDAQLDETMRNIAVVLEQGGTSIERLLTLKVYVRDAADQPRIAARLAPMLDPATTVLYVEADICRAELLLEIEGVAAAR